MGFFSIGFRGDDSMHADGDEGADGVGVGEHVDFGGQCSPAAPLFSVAVRWRALTSVESIMAQSFFGSLGSRRNIASHTPF